jgi:osmotically-inducible protein OsmY
MLAGAMVCFSPQCVVAQQPDNSASNKNQSITADQQGQQNDDRVTTQKIRKAVIADKDLSTYAHNVKIIVKEGQVTLKGPVRSDGEKQKVQDLASQVAGVDKVTNELTVKAQ